MDHSLDHRARKKQIVVIILTSKKMASTLNMVLVRGALRLRPRQRLHRAACHQRPKHIERGLCSASTPPPPQRQPREEEQQHRTARSLREVARGHVVHSLLLPSSKDLICKNMMCEHVGSSCACKLSLVLERLPQLQEMDLSNNKLRFLPESTFQLTQLTHLNLSRNHLTALSPNVQQLTNLEVLDLRNNRITSLPEDALLALPQLKEIRVAGNPTEIECVQSEELRSKISVLTE